MSISPIPLKPSFFIVRSVKCRCFPTSNMPNHNMQPALLLFSLLLAFSSSALGALMIQETKHGVIGYGIPMYEPLCCYSCHDALSSLYLNCTTFHDEHSDMEGMDMKIKKRMDMGGESMGETSDECRAQDQTWLQTLSYCMKTRCDEEGAGVVQRHVSSFIFLGLPACPSSPSLEVSSCRGCSCSVVTDRPFHLRSFVYTIILNFRLMLASS